MGSKWASAQLAHGRVCFCTEPLYLLESIAYQQEWYFGTKELRNGYAVSGPLVSWVIAFCFSGELCVISVSREISESTREISLQEEQQGHKVLRVSNIFCSLLWFLRMLVVDTGASGAVQMAMRSVDGVLYHPHQRPAYGGTRCKQYPTPSPLLAVIEGHA